MRTMYDSVTAEHIPATAAIVAGYDTGPYAWSAADWARFPRAVHVHIATQARYDTGQVLDVEVGDATPTQAPGWVRRRRAAGVDPTVYCNASTWPAVRAAFKAAGVAEPHYWIAKYDGHAELLPGAVAKQYADPGVHRAGHFDLSVVADHWPGIDTKDDDMTKEEHDMLQAIHSGMFKGSSTAGTNRGLIEIEVETQKRVTAGNAATKALAELLADQTDGLTAEEIEQRVEAGVTTALENSTVHVVVSGGDQEGVTA